MKLKTLNKILAAAVCSFMVANASIVANAEELSDGNAIISEADYAETGEPETPAEPGTGDTQLAGQAETDGTQSSGQTDSAEGGDDKEQGKSETDNTQSDQGAPSGTEVGGTQAGPEGNGIQSPSQTDGTGTGEDGTQTEAGEGGTSSSGQENSTGTDAAGKETDTDGTQPSGPANFAEAEKKLEQAKEDETQAKTELGNAQSEADQAQSDVDEAGKNAQEAEDALKQAQAGQKEAEAKKEAADAAVAETEQAAADAEKTLDQALEDANIDEEEFNAAQQELEEKEKAVETAQQAVTEAEAEYAGKQAVVEEAAAKAEESQKAVESAQEEKDAADQAVSDAQAGVANAQQAYEEALNTTGSSADAADVAKKALDEKQAALDAVKQKIASGSLGFFQSMAEKGDSESAEAAVAILTSKDGSGVEGLRGSGFGIAGSWENFVSYTNFGDPNDATSLENMRRTFAFIKECNQLRKADNTFTGRGDLLVNDALMAIAQLNANWATMSVDGKFNSHSQVFNVGENLAWYYVDVPGYDDPFQGWYHEEKALYDAGVTGSKVGHYLNITDGDYVATGFGVNISVDSIGRSRLNASQEFGSEYTLDNWTMTNYTYGQSYTIDEYEARFMAYYDAVMAELAQAQNAYDAAKAAYEQVLGGNFAGVNQLVIDSKKAELDNAKAALEAAQVSAEEKLETLNNAQAAYEADVQKYAEAQAGQEQSRAKLESAQKELQQRREEYEAVLSEMEKTYGAEVMEAARILAESKAAYAQALTGQAEAESELIAAQAVLAAAADAKAVADQDLQSKTGILAEKLQALQEAQSVYDLAAANLAVAQADYDRLKPVPQPSYSEPSDVTERISALAENMGSITVNHLAESNIRKVSFSKGCSFSFFLGTTARLVAESKDKGLTIDCSAAPWFSFNKKTLAALRSNPNVSLTIVFSYMGRKYTFTIPAGFNFDLLQDSNGWYGFMYLKMMFGGNEII